MTDPIEFRLKIWLVTSKSPSFNKFSLNDGICLSIIPKNIDIYRYPYISMYIYIYAYLGDISRELN